MRYSLPRIVVNFKNYKQGSAVDGFDLARILDEVAAESDLEIAIAVNIVDIKDYLRLGLKNTQIWAQHVDEVKEGAFTGLVNVNYLAELGVVGSLLNHSERRIGFEKINKIVGLVDDLGLFSIVCAESSEESLALASMWPDGVAFEPPELIGGNVSVTSSKPEIIQEITENVEVPVFVGAGIKSAKDVLRSLELGAYGVLVASGIVKAQDPAKILLSFIEMIKNYDEK